MLSNMLNNLDDSDNGNLDELFNSTEAAQIIPLGEYTAICLKGELTESTRKMTPGYRITWEIHIGDYAGQKVFQTLWLTPASMQYSKRDLQKLGLSAMDQLRKPLTENITAKIRVAHQVADDGMERNEVRSFEVISRKDKPADPFAPTANNEGTPF